MEQIGSMQFLDAISKDKSYINIRVNEKHVGVAISQEHNGDAEIFLSLEQCQELMDWLEKAKLIVSSQP